MTKLNCLLTIVFVFQSFFLAAQLQDQYLKSSIQYANGRTETVLVLNEETEKLNYAVFVKDSSLKSSKKTYTAQEILSIDFENGKKFRQIKFAKHASKDTLTVLGRLLVTGKIELYQAYLNGAEVLVAIKDGEIYPLQDDEFSSNDLKVKRNFFRSYLVKALRDAPESIQIKTNKIRFDNKAISQLILDYNKIYDGPSEIVKQKKENKNFWIAGALFKTTKANPYGIWGFVNYRLYITDFSRSTSLNTGLHYYNYQFKTTISPTSVVTNTRSITSIPIFVQQNLLNKKVRPYLFAGVNISYINTKAGSTEFVDAKGFQGNFGFHVLGGAGIEWNVIPNLMLKADYRYENVMHGFMGGMAFIF